eukprot:TRINITY_DN2109_c0_g2_i1.p1 TRINITY_DN2109_c0_g2~~TRINITY_DN2109_c0_g2_i1.p1  ORF type:complete len:310 (+),score=52.94 TRINITY_DN2109_c0_g2_i1:161-1090(+)
MASKAVVLMFVACLRFADIGNGVRRDWEEADDVDEGSIDLAHEKQHSLDQTLFFKKGNDKPEKTPTTPTTPTPSTATTTTTTTTSRKMNVLVLHGTAHSGPEMKREFDRIGVTEAWKAIANVYYPPGPHKVSQQHAWYSEDNQHWYNMGADWNFSSALFNEARRSITQFVDKEIEGDVDVIVGHGQGAVAATQLLNDIYAGEGTQVFNDFYSGSARSKKLDGVRAAIFLGVSQPGLHGAPSASRNVGKSVQSLHCQGRDDTITPVDGARRHAEAFTNDTFHVYNGDHSLKSDEILEPMTDFLLSLEASP